MVYELIKTLEALGGGTGSGKEKLETVILACRTFVEQAKDAGIKWEMLEPLVRSTVENLLRVVRS